jgi:hypothetical protein
MTGTSRRDPDFSFSVGRGASGSLKFCSLEVEPDRGEAIVL